MNKVDNNEIGDLYFDDIFNSNLQLIFGVENVAQSLTTNQCVPQFPEQNLEIVVHIDITTELGRDFPPIFQICNNSAFEYQNTNYSNEQNKQWIDEMSTENNTFYYDFRDSLINDEDENLRLEVMIAYNPQSMNFICDNKQDEMLLI